MDYSDIEQIMLEKGISNDPAFDDRLTIGIESMPNMNGCPLGLYYPDTATIVLPYDGVEAAVLHELGHRHGHYYYNNLSENYAESYRKRLQGLRVLLYAGDRFKSLPKFGSIFEEGEAGVVEIALARALSGDNLTAIRSQLGSYGEPPPKVCCRMDGGTQVVRFDFIKGVDWPSIIVTGMVGYIIFTVGAIGYAVYKTAKEMPWLAPVTLGGLATLLIMRAASRKKEA